jgi:uncharacterized membrane protein YheB (UPF0754 family)
MELTLTAWIALPLLGGVIGYITNRIAVKMIFRPLRPVNVLGFRIQGLMPRRQQEIAARVGEVVGSHLVSHEDLMSGLQKVDLQHILSDLLNEALGPQLKQFQAIPFVDAYLTDDRIAQMRESLVASILTHKQQGFDTLEEALEAGLDVPALVTEKVASFPIEKLEAMVLQVAAQELRAIEILGGVLGLLIGLVQVLVLALLA